MNQSGSESPDISNDHQDNSMQPEQTGIRSKKMEESKRKLEFQIPEVVNDLLIPISTNSPTGEDATVEEEYFKLDMEIGKVIPNYNVCIELATEILKYKSKDLRVACWLCFAWYRDEKIVGFNKGLILLSELLKRFHNKLFPKNPAYRSKALHVLNSGRFVKLFERETVDRENAPAFLEINKIFQEIISVSKNQFPDSVPEFRDIGQVIDAHNETAQELSMKESSKDKPGKEEKLEENLPDKSVKDRVPNEKADIPDKVKKELPKIAAENVEDFKITSKIEGIVAIKKILKSSFQQEDENKKYEPYLYSISRSLIWGELIIPSNEDSVTQVNNPDPEINNTLKLWITNQEWGKIIPAIELNFLNEDSSFKYWLTAQRYLTQALERKGGIAGKAAEEVKLQLAKLIMRFPDLHRLKFNTKMPFADEDTVKWIEEEVKIAFGKEKGEEQILPPILGEDYEPINKEYQNACSELPKNFEKNMEKMQKGIEKERRRKGRFLRALNLANFCLQAKQYNLAKVHLSNSLDKIEAYMLTEWEPALCVAVWESSYLVNMKLLESAKDQEQIFFLEKQQHDLFSKIGNYDGVLALRLASRNKKKGE